MFMTISVGPTNMCLFVWLMAEILPRAGDSTSSNANGGASSGSNNCEYEYLVPVNLILFFAVIAPTSFADKTFDEKMSTTLHRLKGVSISKFDRI